jgi:[protein-PII] uridylyltransferase
VDEHTLRALGILHRLKEGALAREMPGAGKAVLEIQSPRVLHVALFCHDIARVVGGVVARQLGPRFGLSEVVAETVAWLVLHHLDMSATATRRDLQDPKTVADVAALVQSAERLRLLFVLTCVDIHAVGPGRWTEWKAALLDHLHEAAQDLISGGLGDSPDAAAKARLEGRVAALRPALRAELKDWEEADFDSFADLLPNGLWLGFDLPALAFLARLAHEADRAGEALTVRTRQDQRRDITELSVHTADHPGLFSELAGAIARSGANIVEAKIFTLKNGMALDVFLLQNAYGGAMTEPDRLARLSVNIRQALAGEARPHTPAPIPKRESGFKVAPRVLLDNRASNSHTIIEINARDRPGLLADITRAITGEGLSINTAKIATFGAEAVDVFYVKDTYGFKLTNERKIASVKSALLSAVSGG